MFASPWCLFACSRGCQGLGWSKATRCLEDEGDDVDDNAGEEEEEEEEEEELLSNTQDIQFK